MGFESRVAWVWWGYINYYKVYCYIEEPCFSVACWLCWWVRDEELGSGGVAVSSGEF
jgi:hypothetical protein